MFLKILKRVGLFLLALLIFTLIAGLFISKDYKVEKSIVINKATPEVFEFVRFFQNQSKYTVWSQLDTSMKTTLTGVDGTEGAEFAWDGNDKAGQGVQEIIDLQHNKVIDYEIQFIRPFKSLAYSSVITDSIGVNQTKVITNFTGNTPYPFNVMNTFMNSMIGNDLQQNLENLKKALEK
jgi:hypothetical protein